MSAGEVPTHGTHSGKKISSCGCHAAHCCLQCPLETCVFDLPLKRQQMIHRRQLVKEMRAAGKQIRAIAEEMGLSTRSLFPRGTRKEEA